MSWGERSCKWYWRDDSTCRPEFHTCNTECPQYEKRKPEQENQGPNTMNNCPRCGMETVGKYGDPETGEIYRIYFECGSNEYLVGEFEQSQACARISELNKEVEKLNAELDAHHEGRVICVHCGKPVYEEKEPS